MGITLPSAVIHGELDFYISQHGCPLCAVWQENLSVSYREKFNLDTKLPLTDPDRLPSGKRQLFYMTTELDRVIKSAKRVNRKAKNLKYLFTNTKGQQITATGFNSAWRRLREAADLADVNFNDIRAKAITDAYQYRGLDYAQKLGGHESRDQTEHYIKKKNTEGVDPIC